MYKKKTVNREKNNWLHIRELKLLKDRHYSIFIKISYDANEEYKEVDIKKGDGEKSFNSLLGQLWPSGKPISEPKLKDIKRYLQLIPATDHGFYTNLIGDETIQKDIDGYN
nr:unnamed protein product [Callosobruchus chinensis]